MCCGCTGGTLGENLIRRRFHQGNCILSKYCPRWGGGGLEHSEGDRELARTEFTQECLRVEWTSDEGMVEAVFAKHAISIPTVLVLARIQQSFWLHWLISVPNILSAPNILLHTHRRRSQQRHIVYNFILFTPNMAFMLGTQIHITHPSECVLH